MRHVLGSVVGLVLLAGCAGKISSLLLERRARGPLDESASVAQRKDWQLEPVTQTLEQGKVEVDATFASSTYLKEFFSNRDLFGGFAGSNPYFLENLVFYVKIANRSTERILFSPAEFILVDDRGNQYGTINEDYVTAIAEAHAPVSTMTRGVIAEARPGYFGVGLPIGKIFAAKPQGRFALIKQSSLQGGFLYPNVVHDGLIAFWSPSIRAGSVRLLITNVRTGFDANGLPKISLEFPFTFRVPNQ
ncbi:MAG: hypothetical protein HYW10_04380 [Candidatus Omnitrophica bacterium]|nr:hypothetical protein [Candidatus Omnitrophota bacterium]